MNKYAIIENETVANIIEADESFINDNQLSAVLENSDTGIAKIGAKFINGKFDDSGLFDDSAVQLSRQKEAEFLISLEQPAEE